MSSACSPGVLLRDVSLRDGLPVCVRVADARVAEIGERITPRDEVVIDAGGAALLPGLHDHHLHALACAAVDRSIDCGPAAVRNRAALERTLRTAKPIDGWLRCTGYDDGTLGHLDRHALDAARPDVPLRLQHRGGSLWVLNSVGLAAIGVDETSPAGVERDPSGQPTGRLWRLDGWLRARLGPQLPLNLAGVSARLAAYGVTGVTDATPDLDLAAVATLRRQLRQRAYLLGAPTGPTPRKLVLSDHELPVYDELRELVIATRPRPVALHCASRVALVLALTVLADAGLVRGDRIEHAAVATPDLAARLAGLGVAVVTQPALAAARGDDYLDRVELADRDALWPYATLLRAGVRVGCSSDAPYGPLDPWVAIAAATSRRTPSGQVLGAHESVPAAAALAGYLSAPDDPGGPPRCVAVGAPADLVLLDRPLTDALAAPSSKSVWLTLIAGQIVHRTDDGEQR